MPSYRNKSNVFLFHMSRKYHCYNWGRDVQSMHGTSRYVIHYYYEEAYLYTHIKINTVNLPFTMLHISVYIADYMQKHILFITCHCVLFISKFKQYKNLLYFGKHRLLFLISTTTFFSFSPEKQKEQFHANLKINILYLDQYIDDCFQEHQSQYCWELSPDSSQPKKIEHLLLRTFVGSIFPTVGHKPVLQYILPGKSKRIPYLSSVLEPGLCFSHRRINASALCTAVSKSKCQVCQKVLLRIPKRALVSPQLSTA